MQTVLFHETIFGPIHSRRLGSSLGVNLSPVDGKVCTFDCLYCEAGFNAQGPGRAGLPSREQVSYLLEEKLRDMRAAGEPLDVITFSGNGEPTMHPDFEGIIDDTLRLRDSYFPEVKVSVLSNSTRIDRDDVCRALGRVDNNILKLDSALDSTIMALDRPVNPAFNANYVITRLSRFGSQCIIQTMITRGEYQGVKVDNTTPQEIEALIAAYRRINPGKIMIYSIDRTTPAKNLEKIDAAELGTIAAQIHEATGIEVQVN